MGKIAERRQRELLELEAVLCRLGCWKPQVDFLMAKEEDFFLSRERRMQEWLTEKMRGDDDPRLKRIASLPDDDERYALLIEVGAVKPDG